MAEEVREYPEPRFYTREFKVEAVRLSERSEKTVAQIARDLGMPVVTGLAYELLEGRVGGATRCVQRLPVRLAPIATASSRMSCAMAI